MSAMCTSNTARDTTSSGVEQQALLNESDFVAQGTKMVAASMPEDSLADHGIDDGNISSVSTAGQKLENDEEVSQDALSGVTDKIKDETAAQVNHHDAGHDSGLPNENVPTVGGMSVLVTKDLVSEDNAYESKEIMAPNLLRIPWEVRDLVYEYFFPRARTIHLTEGKSVAAHGSPEPTAHTWSKDARNLMLSCRKIHEETTGFVYRTNTFVLTPWTMNFKYNKLAPHSNTDLWLSGMSQATKAMVKKLDVHIPKPFLPQSVGKIADGLACFPEVEMTFLPLSTLSDPQRSKYRASFEALCQAIQAARIHTRPILWNDGGDPEVASMLSNMRIGPSMRRPAGLEILS